MNLINFKLLGKIIQEIYLLNLKMGLNKIIRGIDYYRVVEYTVSAYYIFKIFHNYERIKS